MLENMQAAEMLAAAKQRDIERAADRGRMLAEIGPRDTGVHLRQTIAAALVRLATMIDAGAGAQTTAAAH